MAAPKVFVSSTCFDLGEIREQLKRFILSFGFEPVLSENGDVFYKPDLHTHEACIHEVSNCQLFVLVIGGRFGGAYIADKAKSITNAEYAAAREANIPIFTYVRDSVWSSHNMYQQNKKKKFVSEIDYPGIEKQEYALDIFQFIDDVRRSAKNNAIEPFHSFQGIEDHLRKQWAGMVFDLLKSKEIISQFNTTNSLISKISSSSEKLEELVKSLYRSSSPELAKKEIVTIEVSSDTEAFFEQVLHPEGSNSVLDRNVDLRKISEVKPIGLSWTSYLEKTGLFKGELVERIINGDSSEDINVAYVSDFFCLVAKKGSSFAMVIDEDDSSDFIINRKKLFESGVLKSNEEQRMKALEKVFSKYSA